MKKIWIVFLLVLILTGCKTMVQIKPDTIVDIPLHPAETVTQAPVEMTAAPTVTVTQPPETDTPTEAPTDAPNNGGTSGGETTGGKKPGKGDSDSKTPVQPPATEAPTDPPIQPPTEAPTDPPAHDPSGYVPGNLDRAVADGVNARRQAAELPTLPLDTRLCAIASVRAYEASQVWSQNRPDGSNGITVLNEYGYGYSVAAENLYFGAGSADSIVDKWMSSEARKNNILMASATAMGVGTYTAHDGLIYVAVLFVG